MLIQVEKGESESYNNLISAFGVLTIREPQKEQQGDLKKDQNEDPILVH